MSPQKKIVINPSVALMELTIDANYSCDRRLYLANELHQKSTDLEAAHQEIERLNQVIVSMQSQVSEPATPAIPLYEHSDLQSEDLP
ncbi:hypothetical protein ACLBWZ_03375 [Brucellaceae bacterium C25G]